MATEGIERKELEALAEADASVTVPASWALALIVKIEKLEEGISQLKRNSRNSSTPPQSISILKILKSTLCDSEQTQDLILNT